MLFARLFAFTSFPEKNIESWFRSIRSLLSDNGRFIYIGIFRSPDAKLQKKWNTSALKEINNSYFKQSSNLDKLRRKMEKEVKTSGVQPPTLNKELELLSKAGFLHVDILWKYRSTAVLSTAVNPLVEEENALHIECHKFPIGGGL